MFSYQHDQPRESEEVSRKSLRARLKVLSECSATVSVAPFRGATETVALLSRIVIVRFLDTP